MATIQPTVTSDGCAIYSIESRSSIELNLSEVLINGQLPIFKEVEELGLLFLRFQKQKIIVAAGGYIGLIPLTPHISIEIGPKLPVSNLARVLEVAGSSLRSLHAADRLYLIKPAVSSSILEFLASNFVDSALQLEIHGLHKRYVGNQKLGSQLSGRINLSASYQKFWSQGQTHKLSTERFEQTSDIALNRIVKAALRIVLQRLLTTSAEASALIKRASQRFYQFPATIGDMTAGDLEEAKLTIVRKDLPSQREYYYRVIEIAILILTQAGISLQQKGSDITMKSFIVNFDDLFERYIRRALQARVTNQINVLDGNLEGKRPLFVDSKNPPAQPDIVIVSHANGNCIVADVKYKEAPKREDINQAVAYAVSYKTNRTVIIHQVKPGSKGGLNHIGTIGTISVDAYAYNLDSENLKEEEDNLAKSLFELAA